MTKRSQLALLALLGLAVASCGAPRTPGGAQKLAGGSPPADAPAAEPVAAPEPSAPVEPTAPVDTDRDAIPDADDKCPTEPETYQGRDDEDGCPDFGLVIIDSPPPQYVTRIAFARGSSKLRVEDGDTLGAVVQVMTEHPEIGRVLVVGHASEDEGTAKKKTALSLKRAEAVIARIVKGGVTPERLVPAGYGDLCGFAGGHDEAARANNRFVEFKVLEMNGATAGIELACQAAIDAGLVPAARPRLSGSE